MIIICLKGGNLFQLNNGLPYIPVNRVMKHKFIKKPHNCPIEVYENTANKIAEYVSEFPEVLSIYKMGNITVPGISDLDILVVIKDNEKIPYLDITGISSEQEKYTLMHGVFVVPESFWLYRHFFYIYDNLRSKGGNELPDPLVEPSPEFRELLHKRFAIQHILKVYVNICAQLSVYSLKVRPLLCELHALRYDQKALAIWLTPLITDTFQEYCQRIAELRNHWFSWPEKLAQKQFLKICRKLLPFLKQVLLHINTRLDGNHFKNKRSLQQPLKLSYHRHILSHDGSCLGLYGKNPSGFRYLGLLPVPSELGRIKIHNRLSAYQLEIPPPLFAFVANEFNHPLYATHHKEIEIRQAILNSLNMHQIRQYGYATPLLDFQN